MPWLNRSRPYKRQSPVKDQFCNTNGIECIQSERSTATTSYTDYSQRKDEHHSDSARFERVVSFAEELSSSAKDDEVVDYSFRDPSLWYQAEELKTIRHSCRACVNSKARQFDNCKLAQVLERFVSISVKNARSHDNPSKRKISPIPELRHHLEKAARDGLRGLEHYVLQTDRFGGSSDHKDSIKKRPKWAKEHLKRVLQAQRRGHDVPAAALQTSSACALLALEKARMDAHQKFLR